MRWRRNADEGMRRRGRGGLSGDPVDDARILVDRMRAGTLPRWKLNFLRVLDYPPAMELISWAEVNELHPMRPRGINSLVFSVRTLVPEGGTFPSHDMIANQIYRVAGLAQVELLERLTYRPILDYGMLHAPTPMGEGCTRFPFETLARWRNCIGKPVDLLSRSTQDLSTQAMRHIGECIYSLGSYDFGGELTMSHYLGCVVLLGRVMHLGSAPRSSTSAYRYAELAEMLQRTVDDAIDHSRICVEQDWEPKLLPLIAAIREHVVEQEPEHWGNPEIQTFLFEDGIKPALTDWLLR